MAILLKFGVNLLIPLMKMQRTGGACVVCGNSRCFVGVMRGIILELVNLLIY